MADASFTVAAQLDTKGFMAGSKELLSAIRSFQQSAMQTSRSIKSSATGYGDAVKKNMTAFYGFSGLLADIGNRAQDLQNILNSVADISVPTDAYKELANRAERAEQALARMYLKQQKMTESGKAFNEQYFEATKKVQELGQSFNDLNEKKEALTNERAQLEEQLTNPAKLKELIKEKGADAFYNANERFVAAGKELEKTEIALHAVQKQYNEALSAKEKFEDTGNTKTPQFAMLENDIEKAEVELEKLHDQLAEMFMHGTDFVYGSETEEYAQMEAALREVIEAYHEAEEAKEDAFKPPYLQAWEQMPRLSRMIADAFYKIQDVAAGVVNAVTHPVQTLDRALGALVIRLGQAAIGFAKLAVQGAVNALHAVASAAKNAAESLLRMVAGAIHSGINKLQAGLRGLGSALKTVAGYAAQGAKAILGMNKSAHKSAGFDKGFKTIIRYAFGVRSTFFLVRRLRQALIDALGTIAKIDKPTNKALSSMSNALNQVKNSLGTAFQPIITAVAPYITQFLNLINNAITKIAEFFAILVGQDYIVKAKLYQQDYAKSLDKTTKATKKATKAAKDQKNQLAAFDHLNILKANDKTNTGKTPVDPHKLFAKTPLRDIVSGFFKNLKDAIDKEDWFKIGLLIADKLNQAFAKIQSYIKWDNISKTITKYLDIVIGVFNGLIDPKRGLNFKLIGGTIAEGINTIVKSFEHLIDGIKWANLGTGIGKGINGFVEKIDLNALNETLGKRVNAVTEILYNAFTTIDWVGIGQKMVGGINTLIETVKFDELGAALSEGIDGALALLTTAVTNFKWGEAGEKFADLILGLDMPGKWGQLANLLGIGINGALDTIKGFVEKFDWGKEGEAFGEGVNKLVNTVDWLKLGNTLGAMAKYAVSFIKNAVRTVDWGNAGEKFSSAVNALFDTVDWTELGRTLKAMIGVPISFLRGAVFNFKWGNAGTKFAQTVNGFFEDKTMWGEFGETIDASIRSFLDFGQHFLAEFKPEQVATDIKTALGRIKWGEIASSVWDFAKTAFSKAGDFLNVLFNDDSKSTWDIWAKRYIPTGDSLGVKIGKKLSDIIKEGIELLPAADIGDLLNKALNGILDFATTLVENFDPDKFSDKVKQVLTEVDWDGIADKIVKFVQVAVGKIGDVIHKIFFEDINGQEITVLDSLLGGKQIDDTLEGVDKEISDYFKYVIDSITDNKGGARYAFQTAMDDIFAAGTGIAGGSADQATKFFEGFKFHILDGAGKVKPEFQDAMNSIFTSGDIEALESGELTMERFYTVLMATGFTGQREVRTSLGTILSGIMDGLVDISQSGGEAAGAGIIDSVNEGASTQAALTKDTIKQVLTGMIDCLSNDDVSGTAASTVQQYYDALIAEISDNGQVKEQYKDIVGTLFGSYSSLTDGSEDGRDFLYGLIQGMESEDEATAQKAVNIFNAILNRVKTDPDACDEHSPSKRAAKYGKDFVKGFGVGVEDNEDKTSNVVKGAFSNIADVSLAMSSMTYIVTTEMNNIKSIFMVRCYEFNKIVKDSFTTMGTDANTGMVAMKNTVVSSLSTMRSQALTAFNAIATTATTAVNNINTRVSSGFSSVRNNIVNNLRSARNSADNVGWASVGENIIYGINDGLHNGWNWLNKTVKNLARALLNSAKNALGIHSPSTLFRDEVGTMIGLGIGEGIEDSEPEIMDAVVGVADAIADGMGMADAEIDLAVAGSDLLDGLDSVLVEFSARVSNSFAELVTALNDIANSANFRIPIAATGALTPYSVAGAVGDTTSVADAIEASNDDLASVIMQVVNNATSAIVGAIQQSNHSSDSLSVNDIIDEINRRTRAQGRSPLLI